MTVFARRGAGDRERRRANSAGTCAPMTESDCAVLSRRASKRVTACPFVPHALPLHRAHDRATPCSWRAAWSLLQILIMDAIALEQSQDRQTTRSGRVRLQLARIALMRDSIRRAALLLEPPAYVSTQQHTDATICP